MHAAVCAKLLFLLSCTTAELHHGTAAPRTWRARVHPLNASNPRRPLTQSQLQAGGMFWEQDSGSHISEKEKEFLCNVRLCSARFDSPQREGFNV
jgi:hypothetical protein